jgi:hypothetical protein
MNPGNFIDAHIVDMDIFVRTPVWFVQIVDNFGNNYEC